jgi:hypothetical protein
LELRRRVLGSRSVENLTIFMRRSRLNARRG